MGLDTIWKLNLEAYNLGAMYKRFLYFFTKREMYTAIKRNKELVSFQKKERKVYLCALGPSLKKVDLNRIQGDTIVVNRFYKIGKEYPNFVPTYYLVVDSDFTKSEYINDLRDAIMNYGSKGTIFIFNSKMAKNPLMKSIPQDHLFFISGLGGRLKINKKYKIDGMHPTFMNVACAAIFLIVLMGYKDITLLGCDFNSFASTTQVHCYKDSSQERLWTMYDELYAYSIAAKDHSDLALFADKMGCKIINSTKGSLIDAYPIKIEEELYFK